MDAEVAGAFHQSEAVSGKDFCVNLIFHFLFAVIRGSAVNLLKGDKRRRSRAEMAAEKEEEGKDALRRDRLERVCRSMADELR